MLSINSDIEEVFRSIDPPPHSFLTMLLVSVLARNLTCDLMGFAQSLGLCKEIGLVCASHIIYFANRLSVLARPGFDYRLRRILRFQYTIYLLITDIVSYT